MYIRYLVVFSIPDSNPMECLEYWRAGGGVEGSDFQVQG